MKQLSKKLHELNYVKALAIIMMVVIHMIEEFSVFNEMHDTPDTVFQKVIIALSLAPCTHVFLLSIGMGISLSGKKSPGLMAKRALRLLLLGFEGSVIARIAEFGGKRLNTIYLIHWVILGWFTLLFAPLLNIPAFSFEGAVLAGVILAVVSAWITSLLPSSLNLSR